MLVPSVPGPVLDEVLEFDPMFEQLAGGKSSLTVHLQRGRDCLCSGLGDSTADRLVYKRYKCVSRGV